MMAVKPGKPQSYGHLADKLGSSARAVGNACRRNPIPVVIPCHRVVARSGIGGFAGQTRGDMIDYKNWLLEHERGAR
jgi:methylated-DNA-[protein]-cysteine S-methyltransferase